MAANENNSGSSSSYRDHSWLDLSKSGYAKVIFSDLYNNSEKVGCRFQITDNVHEDPCDFIGIFKVGYESLDQCIVSKLLSETECEADGKMLRCTFKCQDLPTMESGFYQFLYVTRDKEVCGASLPFEMKHSKVSLADDIVADNIEDDFLVVRSTMAEQNRELSSQIEKLNFSRMIQEREYASCIKKLSKEKTHLDKELKLVHLENDKLSAELKRVKAKTNELNKANDETVKNLERQVKALDTNLEEAFKNYREPSQLILQLHKQNEMLEKEVNKTTKERDQLDANLNRLTKEFDIAKSTMELLQKELKLKEDSQNEDCASLSSQLEDAKFMIAAMEDSKALVRKEITQLNECNNKLKQNVEQLRNQNVYVEQKLKDNNILIIQLQDVNKELKLQIETLEKKLKEQEQINEKQKQSEIALLRQIRVLEFVDKPSKTEKECQVNASAMNAYNERPSEEEKELRCKVLALELKLKDTSVMMEKLKKKNRDLKGEVAALRLHFGDDLNMQPSKIGNDSINKVQFVTEKKLLSEKSVIEEHKILNTSTASTSQESAACQCNELQLQLREKINTIDKLKEDCLKKDAVVEFLSKEKDTVQKNSSVLEEALNDSVLRLKEAADIYKKQYLEIEKLKKKLDKAKASLKQNGSAGSSVTKEEACSSVDNEEEASTIVRPAINRSSSDSDTGEHVLGLNLEAAKVFMNSVPTPSAPIFEPMCHLEAPRNQSSTEAISRKLDDSNRSLQFPDEDLFDQILGSYHLALTHAQGAPSGRSRESPELQSMIDQNLANLTLSKSKDEEQFSIPCPICNADIGIFASSSDEMIKHLEMQHKQQMCPVCGKMYDMTIHPKYFQYHVEDHFVNRK